MSISYSDIDFGSVTDGAGDLWKRLLLCCQWNEMENKIFVAATDTCRSIKRQCFGKSGECVQEQGISQGTVTFSDAGNVTLAFFLQGASLTKEQPAMTVEPHGVVRCENLWLAEPSEYDDDREVSCDDRLHHSFPHLLLYFTP
ncbi:hypothetical protein C0Q70_19384 [Pomacea canaliculata]|uniref:Uncharacterized protein n=1 Tax=Pomacea canaliculata TaxID=400727 RepID=A0A2T7NJ74_POMCA|nr:hypothetical protein C0Q70_19384 [Pomacea canaliculata]